MVVNKGALYDTTFHLQLWYSVVDPKQMLFCKYSHQHEDKRRSSMSAFGHHYCVINLWYIRILVYVWKCVKWLEKAGSSIVFADVFPYFLVQMPKHFSFWSYYVSMHHISSQSLNLTFNLNDTYSYDYQVYPWNKYHFPLYTHMILIPLYVFRRRKKYFTERLWFITQLN